MKEKPEDQPSNEKPESPVDFHGDFLEYCAQRYDGANLIYPTGYEEAIVGVCDDPALVMSESKAIAIIQEDCKLDYHDAVDHFYYNVKGAFYSGDQNPIWIDTVDDYKRGIIG